MGCSKSPPAPSGRIRTCVQHRQSLTTQASLRARADDADGRRGTVQEPAQAAVCMKHRQCLMALARMRRQS